MVPQAGMDTGDHVVRKIKNASVQFSAEAVTAQGRFRLFRFAVKQRGVNQARFFLLTPNLRRISSLEMPPSVR
jgi:hypothetical protein